jgi:hypothetical protein
MAERIEIESPTATPAHAPRIPTVTTAFHWTTGYPCRRVQIQLHAQVAAASKLKHQYPFLASPIIRRLPLALATTFTTSTGSSLLKEAIVIGIRGDLLLHVEEVEASGSRQTQPNTRSKAGRPT